MHFTATTQTQAQAVCMHQLQIIDSLEEEM